MFMEFLLIIGRTWYPWYPLHKHPDRRSIPGTRGTHKSLPQTRQYRTYLVVGTRGTHYKKPKDLVPVVPITKTLTQKKYTWYPWYPYIATPHPNTIPGTRGTHCKNTHTEEVYLVPVVPINRTPTPQSRTYLVPVVPITKTPTQKK